VPLLADPAWTPTELAGVIKRNGVRAAAWEGDLPAGLVGLEHAGQRDGFTIARVLPPADGFAPNRMRPDMELGRFTSGSTGFPRCLQYTSRMVLAAAAAWWEGAAVTADDRVLSMATFNNGLAFNTSVFAVLCSGAMVAFHGGKILKSAIARTIAAVDPTILIAYPIVYEALVRSGEPLGFSSRFRLAASSAAPLAETTRALWRLLVGFDINDYYGMAELGPITFVNASARGRRGRPMPRVTFAVTDDDGRPVPAGEIGRIRVKTAALVREYLDTTDPPFSANLDAEGRYITCDRGLVGAGGDLVLKGRVGNIVNIAGRKIDPTEIEAALRTMPGVRNVVVHGEKAGADTLLAAWVESECVAADDVVAFARAQLAAYKVPHRVTVMAELPRSSAGKISLGRLRGFDTEVQP
jgi:long-chain acyl-CoA synthetase